MFMADSQSDDESSPVVRDIRGLAQVEEASSDEALLDDVQTFESDSTVPSVIDSDSD